MKNKKEDPHTPIRMAPNYALNKIFTTEQENILAKYYHIFSNVLWVAVKNCENSNNWGNKYNGRYRMDQKLYKKKSNSLIENIRRL